MRVVSLVPALTETLYALGVEPVGVSAACDYPPQVHSTPTIVEPRIDETLDPGTIDERVAERMEDAGSLYRFDDERLQRADPDLILTEGTCEVCSVTDAQIRDTIDRLDITATIQSFHPHTLAETLKSIERLGELLAAPAKAERLLRTLRGRIAAVEDRVGTVSARPEVLVLDWTAPPMIAGHWTPELVERAGGTPLHASPGEPAGPIDWETIRDADPQVLIVAPCGFECTRGLEALSDLRDRPGWESLTAVRENQVYVMDGRQLLNRPGPRLVDTLELIESLVHSRGQLTDSELVATPPGTEDGVYSEAS